MQHATLPYDVKHPMLLPRKHHVTDLIIRFYHSQGLHVRGVNATLADIRQRFWIVQGREAIKAWLRHCQECKRRRSIPAQQIMAPLPSARVNFTRAFHSVAVDFAGPFVTKITRNVSAKRYLCLFTCLQIRAVHCDMVYSLDAAGFLQAFSRFVARRGRPEFVVSDNGRNFVAAEKELKEIFRRLDKPSIAERMATSQIEWQFRPPFAAHQTGIVEAMVKAVKRAVYSFLAYRKLSDEELHTAFVEVEGMLNSRPLSYTSSDKEDFLPLTPNDFLFGNALTPLADPSDEPGHNLRHRWKLVQELVQQVWRRWQREYLTEQQSS